MPPLTVVALVMPPAETCWKPAPTKALLTKALLIGALLTKALLIETLLIKALLIETLLVQLVVPVDGPGYPGAANGARFRQR